MNKAAPLAVRMRPMAIDDIIGQDDVVGKGSWLRSAIDSDALSSIILFGPAGTGKTSLAHVIANSTSSTFVEVSAIGGTVADLRREINAAQARLQTGGIKTILFVDEIHRFSRSQQDALLHAVEDRVVVLVGATTENPLFEVNSALNSRSRIIELHELSDENISDLLDRALISERGLNGAFELTDDAKAGIVMLSGGDARAALTTLELAAEMVVSSEDPKAGSNTDNAKAASNTGEGSDNAKEAPKLITAEMIERVTPHRTLPYDKNKDMHYDVISAFIKSMRGSDPDAALYWLAKMIDGGEDPKFIARRIFILASEDIGNADPQALLIAEAAFKAAEVIGYPECQLILAQAATYMALAPKSNAACGIFSALSEVRNGPMRKVPDHLRDRHRPGSEKYGKYDYPHNHPDGWTDQQYLPDGLEHGAFYHPSERGWEAYRFEMLTNKRSKSG